MPDQKLYDVVIAGGGLAGLSLAILLSKDKYKVALLEKETYPFHRVCGEYISLESWPFLTALGLPLENMDLPKINKLALSSPSGSILETYLDQGGFGISRYKLDWELSKIAVNNGVALFEKSKVEDIKKDGDFYITTTSDLILRSRLAVATTGKRSNLDIRWSREYLRNKVNRLNNYIGIKYHIKSDYPADTITLHNFSNGYCGISKIEDGNYCLCYLTTAKNLRSCNNSIQLMEKKILSENPYLKKLLADLVIVAGPFTISQISFAAKQLIENDVLMVGDAAGMITPLCGNGMSMAFRSASLIHLHVNQFLSGRTDLKELEQQYITIWKASFSKRIAAGRIFQYLFGKKVITNVFIFVMKCFPFLSRPLIKSTHGSPFS